MRPYHTLKRLLTGQTVYINGVHCRKVDAPLQPNDKYIGERNVGPQLLTVSRVNEEGGWVHPVENAYPYDLHECVKVQIVRQGEDADLTNWVAPSAEVLLAVAASLMNRQLATTDFRVVEWLVFRHPTTRGEVVFGVTEMTDVDGRWLLKGDGPEAPLFEISPS